MYIIRSSLFAATLGLVAAQAPPAFEPNTNVKLGLEFDEAVIEPGVLLDGSSSPNGLFPAVSEYAPQLTASEPIPGNGVGCLIAIDLDAPSPTNASYSPLLHWLQPGLVTTGSEFPAPLIESGTAAVATYLHPSPPTATPHRYVFLLFEQPSEFVVPQGLPDYNGSSMNRFRFDYAGFIAESGLGELLEANYFSVGNDSAV